MAGYCTSFSSFCLVLTLVTIFFCLPSISSALQPHPPMKTGIRFIRSKCNSTDYPNLCITSLLSYAHTINNSPLQLADAALNVTLNSAQSTSTMMTRLSSSARSRMSSKEAVAVSDCVETLRDSVEYLQQSLKEMGNMKGKEVRKKINDVQTWVSTALTDSSTCMDGFGGDNDEDDKGVRPRNMVVESAVRERVVRVAQLTSNALALVGELVSEGKSRLSP